MAMALLTFILSNSLIKFSFPIPETLSSPSLKVLLHRILSPDHHNNSIETEVVTTIWPFGILMPLNLTDKEWSYSPSCLILDSGEILFSFMGQAKWIISGKWDSLRALRTSISSKKKLQENSSNNNAEPLIIRRV